MIGLQLWSENLKGEKKIQKYLVCRHGMPYMPHITYVKTLFYKKILVLEYPTSIFSSGSLSGIRR